MKQGSLFDKVKPIIKILVFIDSIFPSWFNKFLLVLFRNFPFYIGILIRYVLIKNVSKSCGSNVIVFQGVIFDAPQMMDFGNNISINPYCYLAGEISIGNDVAIAHTTAMHSMNHTWSEDNLPISYNPVVNKKITIENDVWIGCNVIVLSGVVIKSRSVIAAGAVVTKSFESNSLIAGNPAKFLKNI